MSSLFSLLVLSSALASDPEALRAARAHPAVGSEHLELQRSISWAGGEIVRLQRAVEGIPVAGRPVRIVRGTDGGVRRVLAEPVDLSGLDTRPTLGAEDTLARIAPVLERLGRSPLYAPRTRLVVLPVGQDVHLAWRVDAGFGEPLATWSVYVDAHSGAVLTLDQTSRSGVGRVYEQSPLTSELIEVELDVDAGPLAGPFVESVSCTVAEVDDSLFGLNACSEWEPTALSETGDYRFDPAPEALDDPFAEVQLYHHTHLVAELFEARFGIRYDRRLTAFANFEMANAFWGDFNGDGAADLAFGQTESGIDFAYDADVIYHEYGHAVVGAIADIPMVRADAFGLEWAGGSLNEGTADIVTMILTGDPLLAEYAGSAFGREAIRDLTTRRSCPDGLVGEVHADGEIWAGVGWTLIQHPDVGPDAMLELLVGSVGQWGQDIDWPTAGASLVAAAEDLVVADVLTPAGLEAVEATLDEAGVLDCGRVVAMDDEEERRFYLMNLGLAGDFEHIPLGTQLSITPDDDADRMALRVTAFASEDMGWRVYARRGAPVAMEETNLPAFGIGTALPVDYDLVFDGAGTGPMITLERDIDFTDGDTWYFAITSRNLGTIELLDVQRAWISLAAELTVEEEPRGGCACSGLPSAPPAVLLLGLIGLFRRRA